MKRLQPCSELLCRRAGSACCGGGLGARGGWLGCSRGAGGGGGGGMPLPLAAGVGGWARGPYVWIWIASPTSFTIVSSPAGRSYRRLGFTGTVMDCVTHSRPWDTVTVMLHTRQLGIDVPSYGLHLHRPLCETGIEALQTLVKSV